MRFVFLMSQVCFRLCAASRPHLTMTPLPSANGWCNPPSASIRVFHPLVNAHAGRTSNGAGICLLRISICRVVLLRDETEHRRPRAQSILPFDLDAPVVHYPGGQVGCRGIGRGVSPLVDDQRRADCDIPRKGGFEIAYRRTKVSAAARTNLARFD